MLQPIRKRIFKIIQIGNKEDVPSTFFDIFITVTILLNLFATLFYTFEESNGYKNILNGIETVTVIIFTAEYILRLWTVDFLYTGKPFAKALLSFLLSFSGIVDLLTFLPYYLPFVFPTGVVAFRMFRVIRIFRLFKLNAQYDAFNVIVDVLKEKRKQIFSSVMLIFILMLASSLCMYSLEHEAQPDKFANAFSGMWWSVSTLLTVGYGDIYPITTIGKIMAIFLSFLGVGLVAIPTGIISAGFVEQFTKINKQIYEAEEKDLQFISSTMCPGHPWAGKMLRDVVFPPDIILAVLIRDEEEIVPKGSLVFEVGDTLIFGARHFKEEKDIALKEIIVKEEHEWVGLPLKELEITRQELIVMIMRGRKRIIPNGDTVIKSGDKVIMYSKHHEKK